MKSRSSAKAGVITPLFLLVLLIAVIGGWIGNLFKLFSMFGGEVTAMFIGRLVGTFMFPLGAVLGYM